MLFDPATVEAVRDLTPLWLVLVFTALSFLGSASYQVPMLVLWYVARARARIATWLGIVAGGYATRSLLKSLNDTSRPPVDPPLDPAAIPALVRPFYEHPATIATTSFPSGHAMAATILWGLLVVDADLGSRGQRLAVAITVVAIVAVSRVVLGAHYVGDVVAGVAFGAGFLALALLVRDRSRRPVAATFALAGAVSLLVLAISTSTTATVVLGAAAGVVTVCYAPELRLIVRDVGTSRGLAGGTAAVATPGAVLVVAADSGLLLLAGAVGGAVIYWVPRRLAGRTEARPAGSRSATGK